MKTLLYGQVVTWGGGLGQILFASHLSSSSFCCLMPNVLKTFALCVSCYGYKLFKCNSCYSILSRSGSLLKISFSLKWAHFFFITYALVNFIFYISGWEALVIQSASNTLDSIPCVYFKSTFTLTWDQSDLFSGAAENSKFCWQCMFLPLHSRLKNKRW